MTASHHVLHVLSVKMGYNVLIPQIWSSNKEVRWDINVCGSIDGCSVLTKTKFVVGTTGLYM